MKNTIIAILLVIILIVASCRSLYTAPEPATINVSPNIFATESIPSAEPTATPAPIEQESSDIPYVSTSIDDGIITIDLPQIFTINGDKPYSHIFSASGYASENQDGNLYSFNVYRFYQAEDINMSISKLLEFDKSIETYQYSSQIEYKNIMSNMTFGDGVGHISKIVIGDDEKYTATLNVGEIYYKLILYSVGEKAADEIALRILTSIKLDAEKAKQKSDGFIINMQNNRYYSSRLHGANVLCPENWYPAESMCFSLTDTILSIITLDNYGTATVRYFPKSEYSEISSYNDFNNYMIEDLIKRGFLDSDDIGRIQTINEDSKREFIMYPSDIIIIHFNIEYTDAYYCVELMYSGDDAGIVAQMLDIGKSFTGIGREVNN